MIYQLGDIKIDVGARQVSRGTFAIHLTKKAFELLTLLLHRRPNVVSKEDIHTHLWPDTFVAESSLQALVSEIRQALGESARRQSPIRTAHGVGYAFSAEVDKTSSTAGKALEARAWLLAESWRVPLSDGDNIVGRGATGEVIEIDAPGVSRRHACISLTTGATIEDLGSKNGTWLGDQRVTAPIALLDGDAVRLGSLVLTFRYSRGVDSTDTQAS